MTIEMEGSHRPKGTGSLLRDMELSRALLEYRLKDMGPRKAMELLKVMAHLLQGMECLHRDTEPLRAFPVMEHHRKDMEHLHKATAHLKATVHHLQVMVHHLLVMAHLPRATVARLQGTLGRRVIQVSEDLVASPPQVAKAQILELLHMVPLLQASHPASQASLLCRQAGSR